MGEGESIPMLSGVNGDVASPSDVTVEPGLSEPTQQQQLHHRFGNGAGTAPHVDFGRQQSADSKTELVPEGYDVTAAAATQPEGTQPPLPSPPSRKPPNPCMAFCFLASCVSPPERRLGFARRLCGTNLLLTPVFWGGWVIFLVNTTVITVFGAFTPAHEDWYALILVSSLYVVTVAMLCKAQCTDPGVVPRGVQLEEFPNTPNLVEAHLGGTVNGMLIDVNDYVGADPDAEEEGRLVVWRWCHTCKVHRPPRAAHCASCDWCVKEFDHHCPVVGCCVAERTIRYFTFVLLLLSLQCLIIFIFSMYYAIDKDWSEVSSGYDIWKVLCLFGCGFVSFTGGLWSFAMGANYVYMACLDRTLREKVRGLSHAQSKKQTTGCGRCTHRMFGKEAPSYL